MKKLATLGVITTLFFSSCVKEIQTAPSSAEAAPDLTDQLTRPQTDQQYVPNELLVKFKSRTSVSGRSDALAKIGGTIKENITTDAMKTAGDEEGFFVISTAMDPRDAVAKMKGNKDVVYAEPNWIYTFGATANDTYYSSGQLWGMYGPGTTPANQYGSNAAAAWSAGYTGSASVYVGIIDEGIQFTHPDLSGQVWTNPFDPADGRDNDGNGYVDDIHGWDFAGNNNTIYDGGTSGNRDDHGTHVSGTIAGKGGNSAGVVGVNWNVTLISAKFLGVFGGTTSNAVKAVDYLTNLKTRHGLNIVASNNSWGGGGYSQALYDAISRANNANILFVAAAGNGGSDGVGDNNDAVANYPSNYNLSNVIAVAAITSNGARASFSNYGATTVDLGAPGSGIISTTAYNTYSNYSGTSMATPHVTGACALYASAHPGASAATIKNAILASAVPTASLSGKTVTGGRLDAFGALSK
ncbi:S8 family peptidase [Flavisolibacter nicotianae]|uniref:S8 family peptidase n=1 Tax=Flavisolibacter nicotianae TaxID=2364882 RepID=UPI000EB15AE0|nr:S8 family peptidase [Flavisolibacter nicotianae]